MWWVLKRFYRVWRTRHPVVIASIGGFSWWRMRARHSEAGWYIRYGGKIYLLHAPGIVDGGTFCKWLPFKNCDAMMADMLRCDVEQEDTTYAG